MKISSKGSSRYLAKGDVPNPIIATISDVTIETLENPREQKPVLHFSSANNLKAMVLNVTNRRVLIAAYGDETDHWRNKPVEIYVDPTVPNSHGEIVGGVRVRIPARAAAVAPISRPVMTAPVQDLAQKHAQALAGYAGTLTAASLDAWVRWASAFDWTPEQADDLADAAAAAHERISLAAAPDRRPALNRA